MGIGVRVFLDACIYIYGVEDSGVAGEAVREFLSELPTDVEFVTTDLVRFEVLSGATLRARPELRDEYEAILAICRKLELSRVVVDAAIDIRRSAGLRALDALHLAAAVSHDSNEFWTNDRKMLSLNVFANTRIRRIP